jgi:hypothetical protein
MRIFAVQNKFLSYGKMKSAKLYNAISFRIPFKYAFKGSPNMAGFFCGAKIK